MNKLLFKATFGSQLQKDASLFPNKISKALESIKKEINNIELKGK